MSESPREIGIRWFEEVWNQKDTGAIARLMSPGAIGHLEGGHEIAGPEQFEVFHRAFLGAIPDVHIEILDALGDGENACFHWRLSGSHTGTNTDFAPTGRAISQRGMTWLKVRDGKVCEGWDCWNHAALMELMSSAPV
jgi:predicted ester cyclase